MHTCDLAMISPAHTSPDTQTHIPDTSVSSLKWRTPPMWSNLWDVWCPSVFLSTEWVTDYVCVCVSTTVLLVSSYRVVLEWAPLLPCSSDWPRQVNAHYRMKLNVKHGPLLKPFVFLCGSVALDVRSYARKHIHLFSLNWPDMHKHHPSRMSLLF